MERDNRQETVFSKKIRAGKRRTYFIDVRQTKGEDYYITLTESTKKFQTNTTVRHKLYLYKEDFNRFVSGLNEAVDHVKNDLLPDYDYEQFERRQAEWEAQQAALAEAEGNNESTSSEDAPVVEEAPKSETSEDDMSW